MIPIFYLQNEEEGISETEASKNGLNALIWVGVGEMIAGFAIGRIIDKAGQRATILTNTVMQIVSTAFTLYIVYNFNFGTISYVACFIWGIQDGGLNTYMTSMFGFEFDDACIFSI